MSNQVLAPPPAIITIFGITGDLAKRKLLPSLYHLAKDGLLPSSTKIVGVTRSGTTVDVILDTIQDSVESNTQVECKTETLEWLRSALSIVTMDVTNHAEYTRLKSELDTIEDTVGICLTRIFYLAIPSTMFSIVVERLGKQDLNSGCQHGEAESRLLIEKPFGYDLISAEELIANLQASFDEEQIYRIDHYLAKETVQNILTFRFQNPLFSNAWDADHISHILVTASESIGIEGRVAFYEQIGALRDLIQSHLLQLVALTTMDQPQDLSAQAIHDSKTKLLRSIRPPHENEMHAKAIRAQYINYRDEVANNDSTTETFAAVELHIDNTRWDKVPILVRTGKSLTEKVTEITIVYKDASNPSCRNTLTIRIQPNEGIVLDLRIKKPGFDDQIEHVQMDFCYQDKYTSTVHPDAYERVLIDSMRGDKTLFATSDEVIASWKVIQPILDAWNNNHSPLLTYDNGSWGPKEAEEMAKNTGIEWLTDSLQICSIRLPKDRSDE